MPRLQSSAGFLRALDDNANALNGAAVRVYENLTTTPVTTYSDAAMTIAQPFPVLADAAGRFPSIYVAPGVYRITITTAGGVLIAESDNNVVYGLDPGEVAAAKFKTVPILIADETMGYALGGDVSIIVTAGDIVEAGGFRYSVLASGAASPDLTTAGGVKLQVPAATDGSVPFAAYGPDATGATDVSALFSKAIARAQALSRQSAITTFFAQASVTIDLAAGAIYQIGDIAVSNSEINISFCCTGGRATLKGDGTNKGIVFEQVRNITFENINFQNFTTATEWDTNNIDANLASYIGCDFIDCGVGIDTVSYPLSRSTHLVLDRCRCAFTPRLVTSWCDMLTITNGHFRNGSDTVALVYADSQMNIENNMWTPYFTGPEARWFDFTAEQSSEFSRSSARFVGNCFGQENGGIPIIYSWVDGNTATSIRSLSSGIYFRDNNMGSNATGTTRSVILLMSNDAGTQTLAPNAIVFSGGSWNASSGIVVTQGGLPTAYEPGQFTIDIDATAQAQLGSETAAPQAGSRLVSPGLEKFVAEWHIETSVINVTGTQAVSVGRKPKLRIAPASALSITDLTDAIDGQITTLVFTNSNTTIRDQTTGGAFYLSGGANWEPNANDTLTVVYDRALNRWLEVSRSAN